MDAYSRDAFRDTYTREINADNRHRGPNLAAVAIVYTTLSLASSVIAYVISRGTLPPPFGINLQPRFEFVGYLGLLRIAAFLQFAAAIPLGIFAATAVSRMRFFGLNVAGVFIALFGGIGAAVFMALSGLFQWTLSEPLIATLPPSTLIIHFLSFAVGAVGFAVLFGLLVAGISIVAWFTGLLPAWLASFGIVVAALAAIASLTLLFNVLAFIPPIVHLLGFIWIIAAGFLMPRSRLAAQDMRYPAAA